MVVELNTGQALGRHIGKWQDLSVAVQRPDLREIERTRRGFPAVDVAEIRPGIARLDPPGFGETAELGRAPGIWCSSRLAEQRPVSDLLGDPLPRFFEPDSEVDQSARIDGLDANEIRLDRAAEPFVDQVGIR